MNESKNALETMADSFADYMRALEANMIAEMQYSPETFFDFEPHKIGRYCSVYQWHDIEKSAGAALFQWFQSMFQDITKPGAYASDIAWQKALAKLTVRFGGEVEPALLSRAVFENWEPFQDDLRACNADSGKLIKSGGIPWQLMVCYFWARPQPLPSMKWPLCFWSDKALVSFFKHLGQDWDIDWSDFTLDKWRKFKRAHHLQRPDFIIVRDLVRDVDYKGELIGYELKFKPCPSDKRGVAFRAEGGE